MSLYQLRSFTSNDAECFSKHANNPLIAGNMTDRFPYPYKLEDAIHFIENVALKSPGLIKAIEVENEVCGAIGIHPLDDIHRQNAELGYWLSQKHWGKGIMTEVIREMCSYAFEEFTITRIFARPFGHNLASQKVLEKAGFKKEAHFIGSLIKNNEVIDELVYAIRRENR